MNACFKYGFLALLWVLFIFVCSTQVMANDAPWWEIQSIDTMKYSRDKAREKLTDKTFDTVINQQMAEIAKAGATHVSIGTPYDKEFLPFLRRWVQSARSHNLKVWFRGNFSGWEKWFGYAPIDRQTHTEKIKDFITTNSDLFEDGDLFSSCPECENGGPGDPRNTGDVEGHRNFLIEESRVTRDAFHKTGKNVYINLHSMNGDVARLIMDVPTTQALGGIVTVDHYVGSPQQLADDIREYARISGGVVVLGEYGAPIPDIHGTMSDVDQATWIHDSLALLSDMPELVGINYWVGTGGSTSIWEDNGKPKLGVSSLSKYFIPKTISGTVVDQNEKPIGGISIAHEKKTITTNPDGTFKLPYIDGISQFTVSGNGFHEKTVLLMPENQPLTIHLESAKVSLWDTFLSILKRIFPRFF